MSTKDTLLTTTATPELIDVHGKLIFGEDDTGVVYREQDIPDWYLAELSDAYTESRNAPAGDFHRVASIPVGLVEKMQLEGIDPWKAPVKDVVKWIKNHGYGRLLTSSKSI